MAEQGPAHESAGGVRRLVVGLVVATVAFAAGVAVTEGPLADVFGEGRTTDAGPTIVTGIRSLRDLTTVEAVEFTTITAEDDRGVFDFALGDELRLLAVARVRAGIALDEIGPDDVEIDDESGLVTVRIPTPTIQAVALDNEATEVYDRRTGLLTDGDDQLESEARREAERLLREQALDGGVIDRAEEEAVQAVGELLDALGHGDAEVVVGG